MSMAGAVPSWMRIGAGELTIEIAARPGSSRRGIVRAGPGGLTVAVHSAPDKGKANDELIEWLAETLDIPRSAIAIVRGESSRRKTIRIATPAPNAIVAKLLEYCG
jgi:uncharacterized protein